MSVVSCTSEAEEQAGGEQPLKYIPVSYHGIYEGNSGGDSIITVVVKDLSEEAFRTRRSPLTPSLGGRFPDNCYHDISHLKVLSR